MPRVVALLRGVNLGAARRVAMPALREAVEALGHREVATLLQSGNVVMTTDDPPAATARGVRGAIADRFGLDVDVVVRTARQIAAVVDGNPLADVADDPRRLQVVFLDRRPPAGALDGVEEADLGPDAVRVRGREIYVWSGGGVARSPALEELRRRRLTVVQTARNWSTMLKLRAMLDG